MAQHWLQPVNFTTGVSHWCLLVLSSDIDFHKDQWIYVHKGSTKEVRPWLRQPNEAQVAHEQNLIQPWNVIGPWIVTDHHAFFPWHLQRHGYCTLGEAFNRLDFCSAIKDPKRFNYVVRVSEFRLIGVIDSHGRFGVNCSVVVLLQSVFNQHSHLQIQQGVKGQSVVGV